MPTERDKDYTDIARDGGIFLLFFAGFLLADGLLAYLTYSPSLLLDEGDGFYLHAKWFYCGDAGRYYYLEHHHLWPVLFVWLSALLTHLTHSSLIAGRLISLLAGATVVGTTYLIGREYTGSRGQGAFAAMLTGVNAHLLYYGTLATTDMLALSFGLLALLAALGAINRDNNAGWLFFTGVFVSLACLTRYQYYFLFFGLFLVFTAHVLFRPLRLARNWVLLVGGFILPMALAVLFDLSKLSDLGGLAHLYRKSDLVNTLGGYGFMEKERIIQLMVGYLRGIKLTAWVLGFLPLVGVWGTWRLVKNKGEKRWRPIVLLIPLFVYFLATGWFPWPGVLNHRRLFFLFAPVFMVLFADTFWFVFFQLLHVKKRLIVLIGVGLFVFVFFVSWIDLPYADPDGKILRFRQVNETEEYYPTAFHRQLGLANLSPFSAPIPESIQAARAFVEREQPGCCFVLTDSIEASIILPNVQTMTFIDPADNVAGYITTEAGYRAPEFLMLSEDQVDRLPENEDHERFGLTYLYSYDNFLFYRVSMKDAPRFPSAGQ